MNFSLLAHIHGHFGVLAAAALVHPALLLRTRRRALGASWGAAALAAVAFGGGLFLYPDYRKAVRRALFTEHPSLGWAFERKEHLAVAVVLLAIAGALLQTGRGEVSDGRLRVAAQRAFAAAALLAWVVVALGVAVAAA
jgi:hypothetical protein